MPYFLRVIGNAMLRKIGYVVMGLVLAACFAFFGIGKASAQVSPTAACEDLSQGSSGDTYAPICPSQGQAAIWAKKAAQAHQDSYLPTAWATVSETTTVIGCGYMVAGVSHCMLQYNRRTTGLHESWVRAYPESNSCATRPNLTAGYVRGSASTTVCSEGCQYTAQGTAVVRIDFGGLGEGWTQSVAGFASTGQLCNSESKLEPTDKDECVPIAGQTVCKRADGKLCYSLSSSRRNCWGQAETGQKTDGEKVQVRNLGNQPQPPNLNQATNPTGETPITTTVTNNTTTTTTTTSNHNTVNGSPAGSTNQGEGTTPTGTGDGTGGGDQAPTCGVTGKPDCPPDSHSTGGDDCASPPVSTGDELQVQMIKQAWLNRCAFQHDGDAQAAQFESDLITTLSAGDEAPPGGDQQKENPTEGFKYIQDGNMFTDQLDASGFLGGGACPTVNAVSVGAVALPFDLGPMCNLLRVVGGFVLAIGYLIAFRILAS